MYKFLVGLCAAVFLMGCATFSPIPCEEDVLDVFVDHELTGVAWIDQDCDGVCDRADIYVMNELGVISYAGSIACEDATQIVDEYKREAEKLQKGQGI